MGQQEGNYLCSTVSIFASERDIGIRVVHSGPNGRPARSCHIDPCLKQSLRNDVDKHGNLSNAENLYGGNTFGLSTMHDISPRLCTHENCCIKLIDSIVHG